VTSQRSRFPYVDGARHSERVYDQSGEDVVLAPGDRMFLPCVGGPSVSRLEIYPPRLEIEDREGMYVLVDDGPRALWHYLFVPYAP
jgi:hypothetical protein